MPITERQRRFLFASDSGRGLAEGRGTRGFSQPSVGSGESGFTSRGGARVGGLWSVPAKSFRRYSSRNHRQSRY